jgi:hypothetical protein
MSRLTESERKMNRGLCAGIPGHVQIHCLERGQVRLILQEKLSEAVAGAAKESSSRELVQPALYVRRNSRRPLRGGARHV